MIQPDALILGEFFFTSEPDDESHIVFHRGDERQLVNEEDLDDFWCSLDENFSGDTVVDEVKGKPPRTFMGRLYQEFSELEDRLQKLNAFLIHGAPDVSEQQRFLMDSQLAAMSLYLRTLDLRIQDLALRPTEITEFKTTRVASEEVGEPQETGGHDEDRDGPIPFGG